MSGDAALREAALLADLLLGPEIGLAFENDIIIARYEDAYAEAQALMAVAADLRGSVRESLDRIRAWRKGEAGAHPVTRKYAAYEGLLAYQSLKQNWTLYTQVREELTAALKHCHSVMARAEPAILKRHAKGG